MIDLIADITRVACLVIYGMMLVTGFLTVSLWLLNKIIGKLGMSKEMTIAYREYLKRSKNNE